ncbi:MAG: ring-cleaving dioxygenase [Gemmatimonadaceae bacterium]|nr:ring-cleaving dioxygenase [Gemmatimonadaceae bacterium]
MTMTPDSTLQLTGVHHVSAISAHIGRTHDFYTRVLGLRPVIKTVNQDDPTMYHFFFGDGAGSPGSDMTVFDIRGAAREHRGNNSITRTNFRVSGDDTLAWWSARFDALDVPHGRIVERGGGQVLDFEDSEGTPLALVDDAGAGRAYPWIDSPVPAPRQIRGLGYAELTVPVLAPTEAFLVGALGLRPDRTYPVADAPQFDVHVFTIGAGGAHAEVHVIVRDDLPRVRPGAGGVHHVALRVPESQSMEEWVARLDAAGYRNSGIVDRHYFTSAYVREPNHVLFELATDGPGFEVDGPLDADRLSLPPFLEPRRAEIESRLRPLTIDDAGLTVRAGR